MMYKIRLSVGVASLVAAGSLIGGAVGAEAPQAGASVALRATTASTPVNVWPEAQHDPGLSGVTPDPLVSTTTAKDLGLNWMANLLSPITDSPAIAYNSTLSETLDYVGDQAGDLVALEASSGASVWSTNLGSPVLSSPLVEGGNVWVADEYNPYLYKLNAATGAVECAAQLPGIVDASPTIGTPSGGSLTLYIGSEKYGTQSGALTAVDEATCDIDFTFSNYTDASGISTPLAYGVNKNGRNLIVFGTQAPNNSVYAIDASPADARFAWSFTPTPVNNPGFSTNATISAPGNNGMTDGVAYIVSNKGFLYALDLTTGLSIWQYKIGTDPNSAPVLVGDQVLVGSTHHLFDLNATTGAINWKRGWFPTSSPAVLGPEGGQVAAFAGQNGKIVVINLANGKILFSYTTGSPIVGSFADVDGNLVVGATNGFLYDISGTRSQTGPPTTIITSPTKGQSVSNGPVTIAGTASETGQRVGAVDVAVRQSGPGGLWWDAATQSWSSGVVENAAILATPHKPSSTWTFTVVPPATGGPLTAYATAVNVKGSADTSDQQVAFTVKASTTAPVVVPSNSRVPPLSSFTITGSGFGAKESVNIVADTNPQTTLGTARTNAQGAIGLTTIGPLPATLPFGPIEITATGATSGRSVTITMVIANDWTSWRDGVTQTGFELHDSVLASVMASSEATYLNPAWSTPASGAIVASPAVVGGIAYFGDQSGEFFAINVHTGTPLWSVSLGSAIDSSAAVDPLAGLLFVGTNAGNVVALKMANGSQVWTYKTGAAVQSSPQVAEGRVFFGSDDDSVYDVNESSGSLNWSYPLTGEVSSSPAIDMTQGVVIVGDDSGAVTAISINKGTGAWAQPFKTGGAVDSSPVIFNGPDGTVFVGSNDDNVYALNEGTGALDWQFATGGPINDSGVLLAGSSPLFAIGSNDGTVYYLNPANGSEVNSFSPTSPASPVVGVSAAEGFVVVETASDGVFGTRPSGTLTNWKWTDGAALASSPTVLNGAVYVTSEDGLLHAFTPSGAAGY
jgi:outer membrane protein assembly factor BamB